MKESQVSTLNGLPWWVKGIATVGFPITVTVFLLAQSAGWIPSEVRGLKELIGARVGRQEQHIKQTEDTTALLRAGFRVMCENAARDDTQRRHCENIR